MINLTLKGKPLSNNNIYKTMCRGNYPNRYMSSQAKVLKEDYQWQIKRQYKDKPVKGDLYLIMKIYHPTHRKNDWDNFSKLSMDSMTGLVYGDDSQIVEALVIKGYSNDNPRIDISLELIE